MINFIMGEIQEINDQAIILAVSSVGFTIMVPDSSIFKIGEKITLLTHLQWHQDLGPLLYGFKTSNERSIFLLIISCAGIGPKIALAILSSLGPNKFIQAIQAGNEKVLNKVNGIGLKKAEQIIVNLKHKVAKLIDTDNSFLQESSLEQWHLVVQALESLNYSKQEITATTRYLRDEYTDLKLPFDGLMRHALSFLSKKQ